MSNVIQSSVALKTSIESEMTTCLPQRYVIKPLAEKFLFDVPLSVICPAQQRAEHHALALAVNAAREEEKARLARELHDEVAQSLAALKMDTLWVRDNASEGLERVSETLCDMVVLLDQTVAATRRMATDLRPAVLDHLGLKLAIEWLVDRFTKRCGVECDLCVPKGVTLELEEPYSTALFRIVQESLANVAKHAGASHVEVSFQVTGLSLLLVIEDDGCGYLAKASRKPHSLGLVGLRERVSLMNGQVGIKSALGKGTRVEVSIPLHKTEVLG